LKRGKPEQDMENRMTQASTRMLMVAAMIVAGGASSFGADWPQWQGANRNAMTDERGLLQEWPAGGPPLARKIRGLGGGDGAPAIAKGRILGMGHRDNKEVVWALSELDGHELWATPLGPAVTQDRPQSQEGPSCTPTVDGDRLYVIGMGGNLACLQAADGKIVWQKNFVKDFGGQAPTWSYRESPLIDGEKLICTPGAKDATFVALNKMTAEVIWTSKLPESGAEASAGGRGGRGPRSIAAYASPIAIDALGERQYVQFTRSALVGIAADDGRFLWQYNKAANPNGINCTTPLFYDGKIFGTSAYGAGGGLFKLSKNNGTISAEEVWFSRRMQNHHGGVVVVDGALYAANGGLGGGALVCLDYKTGDVLWDERGTGRATKGSIALADGRIYYRTEEGPIMLIEPSRKEFLQRGRFDQPERTQAPAWSHPVVANGKLYIRDQDLLLCYDVKAK
jgi:outer membrane protein assembly factor BamB